jgi:hypothetical protein
MSEIFSLKDFINPKQASEDKASSYVHQTINHKVFTFKTNVINNVHKWANSRDRECENI